MGHERPFLLLETKKRKMKSAAASGAPKVNTGSVEPGERVDFDSRAVTPDQQKSKH